MANNFADDARIVDFWRFENNLTAGKAGNDLTASAGGVGYESGSPLEGSYSLSLTRASAQYASRADANLSAGFPLKSGDTTKKGMWFFRLKVPSLSNQYLLIAAKSSSTSRGLQIHFNYDDLQIWWGNGGSTYSNWAIVDNLSIDVQYSIGIIFDGVNKTCKVRIYNHATQVATTYEKTFANEMNINTVSLYIGAAGGSTNYFGGLIDEFVAGNGDWTIDEIDQIRQGIFGVGQVINIYGNGISFPQAEIRAVLSHSLLGEGISVAKGEATMIGVWSLFGDCLGIFESEAVTGKSVLAYGESRLAALNTALAGLYMTAHGQSLVRAGSDAYGRKTIDVELLADPDLIVRFRPHIGGGGVLTYRAGAPDAATYWDIVGVGADGFDEPPHGSLRWHYVRADKAGLAANIYIAPTDPALAGHRDRIIVRRADA